MNELRHPDDESAEDASKAKPDSRPPRDSEDQLDRLLARADWADDDPERLARMTAFWRDCLDDRAVATRGDSARGARPSGQLWAGMSLAVAVAALLTLAILGFWRPREAPKESIAESEREPRAGTSGNDRPVDVSQGNPVASNGRDPSVPENSREANVYERLVFHSFARRRLEQGRSAPGSEPSDEELERLSRTLVTEPDSMTEEQWRLARENSGRIVARLGHDIARGAVPDERLGLEMLAHVGGRESLDWLRRFSRRPSLRADAVRLGAPLVDSIELARALKLERDPDLRRTLLAEILSRGDELSVEICLNFVEDPRSRVEALGVAGERPPVAVRPLWAALDSQRRERRLAAALVLGRSGGDEVVTRLQRMVMSNKRQQEALTALLCCDHPRALAFVARARRNPFLGAALYSAQMQLRTI